MSNHRHKPAPNKNVTTGRRSAGWGVLSRPQLLHHVLRTFGRHRRTGIWQTLLPRRLADGRRMVESCPVQVLLLPLTLHPEHVQDELLLERERRRVDPVAVILALADQTPEAAVRVEPRGDLHQKFHVPHVVVGLLLLRDIGLDVEVGCSAVHCGEWWRYPLRGWVATLGR